ncbi:GIY-YIG nuclease family protein [Arthrobacter sp.]|uniref:GIY-YIG nuclease family protein n=1 Tax=Arthrobacter sp. TaxID=1667 RepID=UPI003A9533BA
MYPNPTGELTLGHLYQTAGVEPDDVMVIRHTLTPNDLTDESDAKGTRLMQYTREQSLRNKVSAQPPRLWLNFLATSGRRARFLTAYENHGELLEDRTATHRYFDLRESAVFSALANRLVIEWTPDTVNWAKAGARTLTMPVVEIADPHIEPFPGFDSLLVDFNQLQRILHDDRYAQWRTALAAVQGIYLIADRKTGHLYVGKADGAERFLGRWSTYAKTGHGGNVALRELADVDISHREHFQFSILQVFDPTAPMAKVDAAESHFKKVLLTRDFGLNRN